MLTPPSNHRLQHPLYRAMHRRSNLPPPGSFLVVLNRILDASPTDVIVHCTAISARFLRRVIGEEAPVRGKAVVVRNEVDVVIGASQTDGEEGRLCI